MEINILYTLSLDKWCIVITLNVLECFGVFTKYYKIYLHFFLNLTQMIGKSMLTN